jgi:hypothetical protein
MEEVFVFNMGGLLNFFHEVYFHTWKYNTGMNGEKVLREAIDFYKRKFAGRIGKTRVEIKRSSFFITEATKRHHDSWRETSAFVNGARFADLYPNWFDKRVFQPENGQLVLAFDKCKRLHVARFFKYKDSQAWVDQTDNDHEYCSIEYWMPMPKFPVPAVQDESEE